MAPSRIFVAQRSKDLDRESVAAEQDDILTYLVLDPVEKRTPIRGEKKREPVVAANGRDKVSN